MNRGIVAFYMVIALTASLFFASGQNVAAQTDDALWAKYKQRFLRSGRIVDTGNGNISHSEGQGYGMLLAEAHDDRPAFDAIWRWTQNCLQIRDDHLFAWRWTPAGRDNGGAADDLNDASDGDLLIAWALSRAAQRWDNHDYAVHAKEITRDIRKNLLRNSAFGPVLLPGAQGFEKPGSITVNLSYWLFPAFPELQKIDPDGAWEALTHSGLKLVDAAKFSRWRLPPDWLEISGPQVDVAPGFNAVYGYNAIRIPLHLAWIDETKRLAPFQKYSASFAKPGGVKATVELPGGRVGADPVLPGMSAIYDRIQSGSSGPAYATIDGDEPYFSASLGLLANLSTQPKN